MKALWRVRLVLLAPPAETLSFYRGVPSQGIWEGHMKALLTSWCRRGRGGFAAKGSSNLCMLKTRSQWKRVLASQWTPKLFSLECSEFILARRRKLNPKRCKLKIFSVCVWMKRTASQAFRHEKISFHPRTKYYLCERLLIDFLRWEQLDGAQRFLGSYL